MIFHQQKILISLMHNIIRLIADDWSVLKTDDCRCHRRCSKGLISLINELFIHR